MSRPLALALPLVLLTATCHPVEESAAEADVPASQSCTQSGAPPAYTGPYKSTEDLCAAAPRGTPADGFVPPDALAPTATQNAYALKLRDFLVGRAYGPLGWLEDAHWRLTGPVEGCSSKPENYGVHPAVRIVYSPEVIAWLCGGRQGEIPSGAMIIKEMHPIDTLIVDPQTQNLWVPQTYAPTEWTVMVKGKEGSWDGWFWGDMYAGDGNPPILTRSAVSAKDFPVAPTAPDSSWMPTGNTSGTVVYPYYGLGNYCVNCHASAVSESTYSTLDNLIGKEPVYPYLGPSKTTNIHGELHPLARVRGGVNKFGVALQDADPAFVATFPQLSPPDYASVWATRMPAQTWDHSLSMPDGPAGFLSSDQCQSCHDDTNSNASEANMIVHDGSSTVNISPYGEWRASPMGLAGRDPVFYSQLESERNLASAQGSLAKNQDCIQNLCLKCHGAQGQRQYAQDTLGKDPSSKRCDALMPPEERPATPSSSKLFSRDMVKAWPDEDSANANYGGLARDGVSCTTCHHIDQAGLGDPKTYTGNFAVGPNKEINGPYADPKTKPMEHALNLTAKEAPWTTKGELCSSCHAINLPVFNNDGSLYGFSYEQATYLEWLNSDFNPSKAADGKGKTCQDCHMPASIHGKGLSQRIANIEDATFPHTDNRLPDVDIDLPKRDPFHRHTLLGLNVFLNAFFQQFPLVLGVTQTDYLNGGPLPGLLTARNAALDLARHETATLTLDAPTWTPTGLNVSATVTNFAGHSLPSGVGFRRLFLELLALDANGNALWASGRTNAEGVILDGLTNNPLPTEFFAPGPDGQPRYQPHHQVIHSGDEVQIYEELEADSAHQITTSFLHRRYHVKDNRLRPQGWAAKGPYASDTKPEGKETLADPDYSGLVLNGADTLRYEIPLDAATRARVVSVSARLIDQATPPYYLAQRFQIASSGPLREDTDRLYYLASHLNTAATDAMGEQYLAGWGLEVATAAADVPSP